MNVAFIALPNQHSAKLPPLMLAYLAAVLEQQRHIVRIYDLAVVSQEAPLAALRPLRAFRPQAVVIAGENLDDIEATLAVLPIERHRVLPIRIDRADGWSGAVCSEVLTWIGRQRLPGNDRLFINATGMTEQPAYVSPDDMPLPARHLLPLECYSLRAVGGELQTTMLLGAVHDGRIVLRSPARLVSELRDVSREYGIRHYLFPAIKLTSDLAWLHEFLQRLNDAQLGLGWEASADVEGLDKDLLHQMAQAGCEKLHLYFRAAQALESTEKRLRIKQIVGLVQEMGICTHAVLELEPPYEAMPHLVDVAATFGLDEVEFRVHSQPTPGADKSAASASDRLQVLARQRYDVRRDQQQMMDRYGSTLGSLIWKFRTSRLFASRNADEQRRAALDDYEDLARSV